MQVASMKDPVIWSEAIKYTLFLPTILLFMFVPAKIFIVLSLLHLFGMAIEKMQDHPLDGHSYCGWQQHLSNGHPAGLV